MFQVISKFLIQVFYDFFEQVNLSTPRKGDIKVQKEKELNPMNPQHSLIEYQSDSIKQMRTSMRMERKTSTRTIHTLSIYIVIQSGFLTAICIMLIMILWMR